MNNNKRGGAYEDSEKNEVGSIEQGRTGKEGDE